MPKVSRRALLQHAVAAPILPAAAAAQSPQSRTNASSVAAVPGIAFPRLFEGEQLRTIAFPLGGVATGTISLGGRGDFRDWEIFNRPSKGYIPPYAFASVWAQAPDHKPVARVLEARIRPPYQAGFGLDPARVPGLTRLASASFEGEYPFARIVFSDPELPVQMSLEAFSPFIPIDAEESGLPVAIVRYRATNRSTQAVECSVCFSLDNPVGGLRKIEGKKPPESRVNEYREGSQIRGISFTNPGIPDDDATAGTFVVALLNESNGHVSYLAGWPKAKWWTSPLLFWDDFSKDGELGPEPAEARPVGSLALKKTVAPGKSEYFTFLLAWRFPNRTSEWSGWTAPKGFEKENLGNHYATRFKDAWSAAEYVATNLNRLEERTRLFARTMRESTLPAAVKDATTANLSTLATQTCFRTADGEFHGFEGSGDNSGCCFGNCTHVWNYETATTHVFPSLARSLRKHSFGYAQDEQGGQRFRQMLPDGKDRFGYAAADGQMGQILHAYLDWQQSGDSEWLRDLWPRIKQALSYAWIKGGWDANRDGVLEGVQHNTYDVEFYGPNPLCGIYYLGALKAAENMAAAMNDTASVQQYRTLFESGREWIDRSLFNGEYYVQQVQGIAKADIAASTMSDMGSDDTTKPEFQMGNGCLIDQLIGQYLADVAGLGDLLDSSHLRKTVESIYRYNHKPSLSHHDSVQRIYALNDEAATLICDYGKGERPQSPFPYFAEAWTGTEYLAASLLAYRGYTKEAIAIVESARLRHDGAKRNPWDEAECGHHYARAMSSWSLIPAFSGFHYNGPRQRVTATPRVANPRFRSFWSSGNAWGNFQMDRESFVLEVHGGEISVKTLALSIQPKRPMSVQGAGAVGYKVQSRDGLTEFQMDTPVVIKAGQKLVLSVARA